MKGWKNTPILATNVAAVRTLVLRVVTLKMERMQHSLANNPILGNREEKGKRLTLTRKGMDMKMMPKLEAKMMMTTKAVSRERNRETMISGTTIILRKTITLNLKEKKTKRGVAECQEEEPEAAEDPSGEMLEEVNTKEKLRKMKMMRNIPTKIDKDLIIRIIE